MKTVSATLLSLVILASPAIAEDMKHQGHIKHQNHTTNSHKKSSKIEAEVLSTKRVRIKNSDREHLLAKVRLNSKNGAKSKTTLVDFGSAEALDKQGISVEKGSRIRAEGQQGKMNKTPVFFIYSFDVARSEKKANSVNQRSMKVVEGKVTEISEIDVRGFDDERTIVKINAHDNGKEYLVAVGDEDVVDELELDEGDTVIVKGLGGKINGERALFSKTIARVVETDATRPAHS